MLLCELKPAADDTPRISRNVRGKIDRYVEVFAPSLSLMRFQQSIAGQLKKRKELLYNLGAMSSYASMLTFFWHGVSMLVAKEVSQAHLGCVCRFDVFYDRGDGSLQVGQKVDAD